MVNVVIIGGTLAVLAGLGRVVYMVATGAAIKAREQVEAVGEIPVLPDNPGEPVRGPDSGLYLGTTFAPSWQNKITVGGLSDRSAANITEFTDGIEIARQGADDIWIPRGCVTVVRTESGFGGKVMGDGGVLVVRWVLPGGTEVDSGIRADDKAVYSGWVADFAATESDQ
ncbi:hypothetical protein GII33_11895 [Gordonia pseudamarae]|uniref:PH domain-containing protein n=1 Tax=Gordonia pseudamarae TaxID=2831662 RepID=A0ABX6IP61_9ACTN|nr:hypothetical protein GII33_11895 [Gordonia pseudamarae]QHN37516.1 hypothetical protein GII31_11725 [Gordonia pseudamarae]